MNEAEVARLLSSFLLVGVVAELDEAAARVRVDADGLRTDWIPWGERRAGPGVRTWSAPEVGEQVILACPFGDPAQAVVLASIFQNDHAAPASVKTIHRTTYADGTVVEYDRTAHKFTMNVGSGSVVVNCATATVTASDSVTLDTPTVHATGDLTVDGDVSVQGKADVQGNVTSQGEVKAGTIGLKAHHHTAQGATAPTTVAQA